MSSPPKPSLYPQINDPNPNPNTISVPNPAAPLYPTIDMSDLVGDLFSDGSALTPPTEPPTEQTLVRVPGAVLHLIDKSRSIELASGDFTVVSLNQGPAILAVLARVSDTVQWPLALDEPSVRLDDSHYFFSLRVPPGAADHEESVINYGLTFASKGQEAVLGELDWVLEKYSNFSVQRVATSGEVLEGSVARGTGPAEVAERKGELEKEASAYWTTLAPNVEEYSGSVARLIAKGSGKVVKGILWCGDVTAERLRWGNEFLKGRMSPNEKAAKVIPETMRRIQRVKRMTKMSEKVATGVLSGVLNVTGAFTSSVVNSKAGKKFFSLIHGEIVLATLDGFAKICDAAAEATQEGLGAAGHAVGTACAMFKNIAQEEDSRSQTTRSRLTSILKRHEELKIRLSRDSDKMLFERLQKEFDAAREAQTEEISLDGEQWNDGLLATIRERVHMEADRKVMSNQEKVPPDPHAPQRITYRVQSKLICCLGGARIGIQYETYFAEEPCEIYYCVLESKSFLEKITVNEHTIPFFLPVREAENDFLSSNAIKFIDYLGEILQAYIDRREQVRLIKELYANQIKDLYHSLSYNLIEFVLDDFDCKVTVSLRYADLASILPSRIRVLAWPVHASKKIMIMNDNKGNDGTVAQPIPSRLSYAEDALRSMSLPEAYAEVVLNLPRVLQKMSQHHGTI